MADDNSTSAAKGHFPADAEHTLLVDRGELAIVAVERTRMPMLVTDPRQIDNPIISANPAFLALTGYPLDEVLGRNCRFLQGPATDPADVDKIRRGLRDNDDRVLVEILNYRKDGTTFSNQLVISPVRNDQGRIIYFFASQKDVSPNRRVEQLEAKERLLLSEIDHRASNALALVQTIVSGSRADTVADFSSQVSARIRAVARAHRLLANSGWGHTDIGPLVEAEISAETRDRVQTRGGPLQVPAFLVQPLALVLHELMSNATQHGALATASGLLDVTWSGQLGAIVLEWTESGVDVARPPAQQGFGLKTVKGLVEYELGGEARLSWPSAGFQATLTLPAA